MSFLRLEHGAQMDLLLKFLYTPRTLNFAVQPCDLASDAHPSQKWRDGIGCEITYFLNLICAKNKNKHLITFEAVVFLSTCVASVLRLVCTVRSMKPVVLAVY